MAKKCLKINENKLSKKKNLLANVHRSKASYSQKMEKPKCPPTQNLGHRG